METWSMQGLNLSSCNMAYDDGLDTECSKDTEVNKIDVGYLVLG